MRRALACLVLLAGADAHAADYLSPIALVASRDGKRLYVAEATAKQVATVNLESGKPIAACPLPLEPSGLALMPDGKRLVVTAGGANGKVFIVALVKNTISSTIPAGHTPMAPVVSPDGKTLYVCNRFNNEVQVIDLATGKTIARIPVTREPVAAVLTLDGKSLFVANHLPTGAANVDRMTSLIDVIDTASGKVATSIPLPNGAIDLRGMCLSPDGKIVYVPSILARFMVPTTQIERGWMNTHALNLIDAEKRTLRHTVLLDDVDLGAANPWGIACSPDGKYIAIAHSATHEISLIDQAALLAKLDKVPRRDESQLDDNAYEALPGNPINDLSFLSGIRQRVKLKGNGPRGVAAVGDKVYASEYFTGSLGVVTLAAGGPAVQSLSLGREPAMTPERKGEMLFNDASGMCFQQWQSCSTCHPDARMDAVNWDLLNDGIGNPKSTKSLVLSAQRSPVMARGVRKSAEEAVRTGMKFIQFMNPDDERADPVYEYIKSLRPVPSPYLVNGRLSPSAERGKAVFEKASCSACHSGPYHTDTMLYDVGTADGIDKGLPFVTPTLCEVWRTAPYLFDGRAATLEEAFTKYNGGDRHGRTSGLGPQELKDLIEYVNSL
ncbi:MAG: cell surface protein [Verrucomicrobiae bacterium]